MVWLILTLEILLGLKSKKGDVTAAYIYENIGEGENVYVDKPKGFEQYLKTGRNNRLKFKKTINGLNHSSREFYQCLTKKLEACGLRHLEFDPCLPIVERFLWIVYVDDIIFWARNKDDIHDPEMELQELGIDLEHEYDVAEFTGVTLEQDLKTGLLYMIQNGIFNVLLRQSS